MLMKDGKKSQASKVFAQVRRIGRWLLAGDNLHGWYFVMFLFRL